MPSVFVNRRPSFVREFFPTGKITEKSGALPAAGEARRSRGRPPFAVSESEAGNGQADGGKICAEARGGERA